MNKRLQDSWLKKFIEEAMLNIKEHFQPEKVMIFGSRASGEAREDSDLDIIIVSDVFKGVKFLKRMPMVLKKIKFPKHIDYICYSPDELERIKNSSSVIKDALQNGVEISL